MSATDANGIDGPAPNKQAACLECRRSKIKCVRDPDSTICKRCSGNGADCVIPAYHVGRYKGVKNKRSGLEKAIHQVEQALKKSKGSHVGFDADKEIDLRQLIDQSQTNGSEDTPTRTQSSSAGIGQPFSSPAFTDQNVTNISSEPDGSYPSLPTSYSRALSIPHHDERSEKADELAVDNADNPLQLLAMASSMPNQSPSTVITPSPGAFAGHTPRESDDTELQQFFGSMIPVLDNTSDIDPIEMGLVTQDEADYLFKYFYDNLQHTRWGLDPELHTTAFVRSRSAFLFTSVLAAAATFMENTAALAKRLAGHRERLAQRVITKRHRSIEIVLAFMINIPWMSPGIHWTDDETTTFLSMALTLALDLQLNKIVVPSPTIRPAGFIERVSKADCIDAGKALQLDGFGNVDPTSQGGRRLLRSRERVWLSLFNLDRGICLARGRPYAVPTGPLIDSCDTWHMSDIPDKWDGSIIASCVMRRDLVALITSVREKCDNGQLNVMSGSAAVKVLKDQIDRFFEQWYSVWTYQITIGNGQLPPYVEILVSHTQLSVYCSVINHPTASSDVKQFFRAAGLTSALNVMRVVVQNESRLKSMPNNSVIMVSFAACFTLGLSTSPSGEGRAIATNARSLIEQTAKILERIGTIPKHRNGTSALFGRHIQRIMRLSYPEDNSHLSFRNSSKDLQRDSSQMAAPMTQPALPDASQSYTFDMTDDQIIEAINNASASQELFQIDESMFLDWLEWPNTT
jgi:hypothetical protein